MTDKQERCPNCGALVVEGADWCGQCYTPLKKEPQVSSELPRDPAVGAAAATGTASPSPVAPVVETSRPDSASRATDIAAQATESALPAPVGDEPTWKCPACGQRNPLELEMCALCGTPFARLFDEVQDRKRVAPEAAFRASIIPGFGHWICGRKGEATLRAGFILWGLVVGLVALLAHAVKLHPVGALYVLSAVIVYAESFVDARRLAGGYEQILPMKVLLYWFAALIFIFMISVFAAFLSVTKHGLTPGGGSPTPG
jgi:hypothetical protein